jgi:uncharacterized protein involved in response to NO
MQNFQDPKSKENYFLSQPHQPFFIAGIFWTIVTMIVFGVAYKLLLKGDMILHITPSTFHAYSLIFIVITQFFIGFLYTTFPKFCQTEVVSKPYYLRTFALFQVGALLFIIGAFLHHTLLLVAMGLLFIEMFTFYYKLYTIYQISKAPLKEDQYWILMALSIGLTTHFFAILEVGFNLSVISYPIAFSLYVTFLTFSVAQRMVPFFSHSMQPKQKHLLPIVFLALVVQLASDLGEIPYLSSTISLLLGTFLLREFISWKLNFRPAPAILKILHVALFWLPIGLILGAVSTLMQTLLESDFLFAQTHLIALGFIITMLIGFGTRVTLGHSGRPPHADSTTMKIFYLTQAVVLGRLILSIGFGINPHLFFLFDISLTLWIGLFIFWAIKFAPLLIIKKSL